MRQEFLTDVIDGLSKKPKSLPSKYFYDETGSQLFERICALDEYYLTRVELRLLASIRHELAVAIGPNAAIIEPGAGAGIKIQTLLETLESPSFYAPLDLSEDFLLRSARAVRQRFPLLPIVPLIGDFTQAMHWPKPDDINRRVVFFPGSTLGNFESDDAMSFLKKMRELIGSEGALILGVDMVKAIAMLEAAYDDREGVTETFNKNLLVRINNELGGNFDTDRFSHKAFFNEEASRIEMHLESRVDHEVKIDGHRFKLGKHERIHTENSHKFTLESIHGLARRAGLVCRKHWLDEQKLFSIHFFESNEFHSR
ncbi:MAG: L-histidine N(alpha)-methyltransferase [Methylococcaceae bacterium]|nr:L-histidine N(alpha)-methyltransferase [Methylococcaceae bacterium]